MWSELAKGLRVSPDEGRRTGAWIDKKNQCILFDLCQAVFPPNPPASDAVKTNLGCLRLWMLGRWSFPHVAYDLFFPGGSPPDLWGTVGFFFPQQILFSCYSSVRSLHLIYIQVMCLNLLFQPCDTFLGGLVQLLLLCCFGCDYWPLKWV